MASARRERTKEIGSARRETTVYCDTPSPDTAPLTQQFAIDDLWSVLPTFCIVRPTESTLSSCTSNEARMTERVLNGRWSSRPPGPGVDSSLRVSLRRMRAWI